MRRRAFIAGLGSATVWSVVWWDIFTWVRLRGALLWWRHSSKA